MVEPTLYLREAASVKLERRNCRKNGAQNKKPGEMPGLFLAQTLERYLKFLVELAGRTRDIDSARNTAFAVFDALDDARGLATFGTVGRLRRVHYLLAITSLCNLCHGWGVSPS